MHGRLRSLFVTLVLAGCAHPVTLDAYSGPREPDSALAIIRCFSNCMALIQNVDDPSVDYDFRNLHADVVRLKPGTYDFQSWITGVRPYAGYVTDTLNLFAGHRYIVRGTTCDGEMRYVWYEDEATGEIVSGFKPHTLWVCHRFF